MSHVPGGGGVSSDHQLMELIDRLLEDELEERESGSLVSAVRDVLARLPHVSAFAVTLMPAPGRPEIEAFGGPVALLQWFRSEKIEWNVDADGHASCSRKGPARLGEHDLAPGLELRAIQFNFRHGVEALDIARDAYLRAFVVCAAELGEGLAWLGVTLAQAEAGEMGRPARASPPGTVQRRFPRRARHVFYEALLRSTPTTARDATSRICAEWRELTGADWVYLWHFNPQTRRFELDAVDAPAGIDRVPKQRVVPGPLGIAMYCCRSRSVVRVSDIESWCAQLDGAEYRITEPRVFVEMGCRSAYVIPFLGGESATGGGPSFGDHCVGAISLHSTNAQFAVWQPRSSLLLMGRLSGQLMLNATVAEERSLLAELNEVSHRHVTRTDRSADEVREAYLEKLTELLLPRLGLAGISFFCRNKSTGRAECAYTTGILDRQASEIVARRRWKSAHYRPGESKTGRCFAEAVRLRFSLEEGGARVSEAKFVEVDRAGQPILPAVLDGISGGVAAPGDGSRSVAVIRYAGFRAPVFPGHVVIGPHEERKLDIIREQVGPVLRVLEERISREQSIRLVRHELRDPIMMIRNAIDDVRDHIEHGRPLGHALDNLDYAPLLLAAITGQLATQGGDIVPETSRRRSVSADLIPRVVALMRPWARAEFDVSIEYEGLSQVPPLFVDLALVERAVYNLIANAVKYASPGSIVRIEARSNAEGYFVDFSNVGLGIPDEELEEDLFELGFRGRAAQLRAQGLGFGLWVARTALRAHGGDVMLTARREPTVFTMFFPRSLRRRPPHPVARLHGGVPADAAVAASGSGVEDASPDEQSLGGAPPSDDARAGPFKGDS